MYNDNDFVEGVGELKWYKPDIARVGIAVGCVDEVEEEFEVGTVK